MIIVSKEFLVKIWHGLHWFTILSGRLLAQFWHVIESAMEVWRTIFSGEIRQKTDDTMITDNFKKPLSCSRCGKTFTQAGKLKIHERTHTGDKPFIWSDCNYNCSDLSNLQRHERRIHNEKSFTCPICDKMFGCVGSLKDHEKVTWIRKHSAVQYVIRDSVN